MSTTPEVSAPLEGLAQCDDLCERLLSGFRRDRQRLEQRRDVDLLALARAPHRLIQIEAEIPDGMKLVLELPETAMAGPGIDLEIPFRLGLPAARSLLPAITRELCISKPGIAADVAPCLRTCEDD